VNTVSDKVVYLSVQKKWFARDVAYFVKIWRKLANPLQKRLFPMYIRSQRHSRNTYRRKFN